MDGRILRGRMHFFNSSSTLSVRGLEGSWYQAEALMFSLFLWCDRTYRFACVPSWRDSGIETMTGNSFRPLYTTGRIVL
jgi:hypothetical protein